MGMGLVPWLILMVAAGAECRSESDSNTDGEMSSYPHEDAAMLGHEKSEEVYKDWGKFWDKVTTEQRSQGILEHGTNRALRNDFITIAFGLFVQKYQYT